MTEQKHYPADIQQIEQGLKVLQRRKFNLKASAVFLSTLGMVSLVAVFFQQELVFNVFGITQQINQIHLPYMIDARLKEYIYQPDYLMNAFSWLGWLILKLIVSFIGAFIIVGFLKRFKFFLIRFQSFILKFVAWLITFILLWGGLTYIQYELKDDEDREVSAFVQYDQNIHQSDLYQYLQKSDLPETAQNYLLAQSALMHKPVDKVVATVYAEKLIKAEQSDPQFLEYGFRPEQLWTIQHQVFNQAVSPIAKSVESQVKHATFWSNMVEKTLWVITAISLLLSFMIYMVSNRIGKRLQRIGKQLK